MSTIASFNLSVIFSQCAEDLHFTKVKCVFYRLQLMVYRQKSVGYLPGIVSICFAASLFSRSTTRFTWWLICMNRIRIQANAIIMENESKVYCQSKLLFIGPISFAPTIRPRLEIVIYKVNWVAEIFFQQHCIAVAKTPMVAKTYSTW